MGRFTTVDPNLTGVPFPKHLLNPQSWNMYGYALYNPLRYIDPSGEDFETVVTFNGNFTDEEKRKILAAITAYLNKLDIGKVVVRQSTDKDKRTGGWTGQVAKDTLDFLPGFEKSFATITADLEARGVSNNHSIFKAGGLQELRKTDAESFVTKVADGILHEILAHQLGFGRDDDNWLFNVLEGTKEQARSSYFQTRKLTLMDSSQWRVGVHQTQIRPLYSEDQQKIQERLKPIDRKYDK